MRLKDLVKGQTPSAQAALNSVFSTINEERILWYPSAGTDYRDLIEMTETRRKLHEIDEAPNIYCHTDYSYDLVGLDQEEIPFVIHRDDRTEVRIVERHALCFVEEECIEHKIDRDYVTAYPRNGRYLIFLLHVNIQSDSLGCIDAWVFFFLFENHNFLDQIVLGRHLRVTHLVKVRQGCGLGGCRKCISVIYPLLAHIGVKYLLIDGEIWFDLRLYHQLAVRHSVVHRNFRLDRAGKGYVRWSHCRVFSFRVNYLPGGMSNSQLNELLKKINRGWFGKASDYKWKDLQFFPEATSNLKCNTPLRVRCTDADQNDLPPTSA